MTLYLPEHIREILGSRQLTRDEIGLSSAGLYLTEDLVLKIGGAKHEADIMRALKGTLPVPELLAYEDQDGQSYLLMSRLPGKMLCHEDFLRDPERLTALLVQALQMLWSVDITQFSLQRMTQKKLSLAQGIVERGECDVELVDPATFGKGGFASPADLLDWLISHQPKETLVFSHGDLCLPNLLADEQGICGFIDLGFCGLADPWQDISLAYRSLRDNLAGCYGGTVRRDYPAAALFEALNIPMDEDKLRWYLLLDELF